MKTRKPLAVICLALYGALALLIAQDIPAPEPPDQVESAPAGSLLASLGVGAGPASGFVPVTHTYNSGSATETIQTGASQLVVKVWGAGGGGRFSLSSGNAFGGGGGAYSIKTISGPFSAGTISYSVGAGGAGKSAVSNGDAGGSSSAGGGGQLVNIANVGGGAGGTQTTGTAGTAGTGGDTNSAGGAGANFTGGTGGGGGLHGNGGAGSNQDNINPSDPGINGSVSFEWS